MQAVGLLLWLGARRFCCRHRKYYICPAPLRQPLNYPPKLGSHTLVLQCTLRPHPSPSKFFGNFNFKCKKEMVLGMFLGSHFCHDNISPPHSNKSVQFQLYSYMLDAASSTVKNGSTQETQVSDGFNNPQELSCHQNVENDPLALRIPSLHMLCMRQLYFPGNC